MNNIYLTLMLALMWASLLQAQQLPYRSSFAAADFIWNPAMTAPSEYLDWGISYRQQWLGFEQAPSTAVAHLQYPFVKNNMSAGGWAMRDEAGPLSYYQAGATYSYKLQVGRFGLLAIGLSASLSQYQFDGAKALAIDSNDPLLIGRRSSAVAPNAGVGFWYVSNKEMYESRGNGFFIGLGSQQLLVNDLNFEGESREVALRRAVHANAAIGARFINDYSFIEPSLWIDYAHHRLFYARANLLFELEDVFWGGASLATDYTLSLQGGVILNGAFLGEGALRLGAMGTYGVGTLGSIQGLGFEVMVTYRYWR
jgi:type IX secretion system PorP/SprF family membrane protein